MRPRESARRWSFFWHGCCKAFQSAASSARPTSYLIESAPAGQTGFYGSWQIAGQLMANALGAAIGVGMTSYFSQDQLAAGAWRIPFLVGLVIVPIVFYMRATIVEPESFRKVKSTVHAEGFFTALKSAGRNYLIGIGMVIASAVTFYVAFGYTVTYAKEVLKLPVMQSFVVQMVAAIVMVIVVPIAGAISDRYPRKPLLLASLTGYFVLLYPLYAWVVSDPSITRLLVCQIATGVVQRLLPRRLLHDIRRAIPCADQVDLAIRRQQRRGAAVRRVLATYRQLARLADRLAARAGILYDDRRGNWVDLCYRDAAA